MRRGGEQGLLRAALDACPDAFLVHVVPADGPPVLRIANAAGRGWLVAAGPEAVTALEAQVAAVAAAAATLTRRLAAQPAAAGGPTGAGADPGPVWEAVSSPVPADPGRADPEPDAGGGRLVVTAVRDVSQEAHERQVLARVYEETAAVRATLQTALDATSDAFAVYDPTLDAEGRLVALHLVMINIAGAYALGGAAPEDLVGLELSEFYPPARRTGLWEAIEHAVGSEAARSFRLHEYDESGGWVGAWDNTIAPVADGRVALIWRDVSGDHRRERELAEAHQQARHSATHDPLTGLANRLLLVERLRQSLVASERVGVAYLDLDGFKQVNDTLGHAAGDQLLVAVAKRLARLVRHGDLAARLGGDEFVLLLQDLPETWDADAFVARALAAIAAPLDLGGVVVSPQGSFGVATSPPAERTVEGLLHAADERMYEVKARRKDAAKPSVTTP